MFLAMDIFRVRLNCIDHYQAAPTKFDPHLGNDIRPSQNAKEPKNPVIRVFGSTQAGQKVCAHIHGAFPYLYVEYDGSLLPEEGMRDSVSASQGKVNADTVQLAHISTVFISL